MTHKKLIYILSALFLFFGVYAHAGALMMSLEKPTGVVQVGDTVLVKVLLDTDETEINVLEGSIGVVGDVGVDFIQTGGSIFTLWPVAPVYKNNTISFTGGTPSSVFGKTLQVFTLAVTPRKAGIVTFNTSKVVGYVADGNGTAIQAPGRASMSFSVAEKLKDTRNDLETLLSEDTTSPEPFSIEYARDFSVHDGKVFLSFYTTDGQSGVHTYEVIEEGQHTTVTDGTYVVKNQNLTGKITVIASDAAGNKRTESIAFGLGVPLSYRMVIVGLLLVVCAFLWWWFRKKRHEAV